MDVLIVTGSYPPETGGIGELMKGFTDALSSAGIGVSVLASVDGAEKLSSEQIPVSEFRLPNAGYIRRVLACRTAVQRQLAKGSFDRVLVSSWSPFAVGLAPASRVLVLNPGIDAQRFAPGERPEQLANHLGIGPENRVLLSLSCLVPRKGFDLTLRALPRVLEAHPSTLYVIAGEGPDRRRLEELTASLGLGDHVRFAGPVSAQELPLYYRLPDLFVMPSRFIEEEGDVEGFGIVFLEAALSGVASVGGRSGGIPDAVLHGETGLLVDPKNEIDCAAAIADLLSDNARLTRLGQQARARARAMSQFSWNTVVKKYLTWIA